MVDIQVNTDSNNSVNIDVEASQGNASVILEEQAQIISQIGAVALYGPAGRGIVKIEKTGTSGLVDTYTIYYTNGNNTTFDVTNGQDGTDGYSPTATVTQSDNITTITITDKNGTTTESIDLSGIVSDIEDIQELIPSQATSSNQLADKDFVNSSIATNTANFIGTFANVPALIAYSGTVTNNDYAFVVNSVIKDNGNDWATFAALDAYDKDLVTNFDYAWVINGTKFDLYRFDILTQSWGLRVQNTDKSAVTLNTAYNRYKAVVENSTVSWEWEYTLNNSSFTASQWAAINSGITSNDVTLIGTALQPNDNVSELVNDAGYLVSTDFKTINSTSLIGSGNISVQPVIDSNNKLDYAYLSNTPTIPTVNNATLTIQKNGTTVNTFTANASSNVTANITVPTDTSDLTNNAGYITGITSSDVTTALGYTPYDSSNPSGYTTNVGTVTSVNNVQPINGNVTLSIPAAQVNSDWNAVSGVAQILNKPNLATVATSGSYNDLTNKPTIPSEVTESTVSGWGFTKNVGTVTSVNNISPVNGNVTISIPDTATWGNITGTLSNQTDLQNALDNKVEYAMVITDYTL